MRKTTWHTLCPSQDLGTELILHKINDLQKDLNIQAPCIKKKKKHLFFEMIAMAQAHCSFSNIWIQWSAFVQSTVARATQMCWQGFSQSAISRTASYNPPFTKPHLRSLRNVFKHLASAHLLFLLLPLALQITVILVIFAVLHFPNICCPMCNLVSPTVACCVMEIKNAPSS